MPHMLRYIDLTHPIAAGQPSYPGDPPLVIEPAATIPADGYNVLRLSMGTHQGTHMDAPRHFFDDGRGIDQVALERLCGPARLVDLAPGAVLPAGTVIDVEMLLPHADVFRPGSRILYRTGWSQRFGRPAFYEGVPSLSIEAAEWIAGRGIALLGMDTPTPSEPWPAVHRILLAEGCEVAIVESMANLDQLPARFTLIVLPLPIVGGDGSPVRAVGMVGVDEKPQNT